MDDLCLQVWNGGSHMLFFDAHPPVPPAFQFAGNFGINQPGNNHTFDSAAQKS